MKKFPSRRNALKFAYGVWYLSAENENCEVLFARDYTAMFVRAPGKPAVRYEGPKRVPWVRTRYLHGGGLVNHSLYEKLVRAEADFVAGREVAFPFLIDGRAGTTVPERPKLMLIVNNSNSNGNVVPIRGAVSQIDDGVA